MLQGGFGWLGVTQGIKRWVGKMVLVWPRFDPGINNGFFLFVCWAWCMMGLGDWTKFGLDNWANKVHLVWFLLNKRTIHVTFWIWGAESAIFPNSIQRSFLTNYELPRSFWVFRLQSVIPGGHFCQIPNLHSRVTFANHWFPEVTLSIYFVEV